MISAWVGLVATVLGAGACSSDGDKVVNIDASVAVSVWNASVTALEFRTLGGFPPPPPQGSQCAYQEKRYRLTVGTRTLDAARCESGSTAPYRLVTQTVVLSEDQLHQLEPAFSKLTRIESAVCPLDAGPLTLQVTTSTAVTEYDYCGDHPALIDYDKLSAAMTALGNLVPGMQSSR